METSSGEKFKSDGSHTVDVPKQLIGTLKSMKLVEKSQNLSNFLRFAR